MKSPLCSQRIAAKRCELNVELRLLTVQVRELEKHLKFMHEVVAQLRKENHDLKIEKGR